MEDAIVDSWSTKLAEAKKFADMISEKEMTLPDLDMVHFWHEVAELGGRISSKATELDMQENPSVEDADEMERLVLAYHDRLREMATGSYNQVSSLQEPKIEKKLGTLQAKAALLNSRAYEALGAVLSFISSLQLTGDKPETSSDCLSDWVEWISEDSWLDVIQEAKTLADEKAVMKSYSEYYPYRWANELDIACKLADDITDVLSEKDMTLPASSNLKRMFDALTSKLDNLTSAMQHSRELRVMRNDLLLCKDKVDLLKCKAMVCLELVLNLGERIERSLKPTSQYEEIDSDDEKGENNLEEEAHMYARFRRGKREKKKSKQSLISKIFRSKKK